jgi:hypothetical protein
MNKTTNYTTKNLIYTLLSSAIRLTFPPHNFKQKIKNGRIKSNLRGRTDANP